MSEPSTPKVSRRSVLASVPAAGLLALAKGDAAVAATAPERPKIAALVTEVRKLSHGEVILDRFLEGFGWETEHYKPQVDLVALFVDQFPAGDLSRERASRFAQLKIYPSVAQALCRGGDRLAVDGVVIIGEHGNYPQNEKKQTLYPRYEFFKQTVDVFRTSGRSVPVFNDKHLSWNWDWAKEMVDTAATLGFPLMAASSVPISWRIPSIDMPLGAEVEEVVAIGPGPEDSYDFHVLEAIQAMVERRRGGESGVSWLQARKGPDAWKQVTAGLSDSGGVDPRLFEACLCRSQQLKPAREGFSHVYPTFEDLPKLAHNPVVYRYEHSDGLKATMMLTDGLVDDIMVAARLKGRAEPLSTLMYLGAHHDTQPHNFDALVWHIEQFIRTGKSQLPIERTLLTTGLVAAGMESLARGGQRVETPHLAVRYKPTGQSTFRRS